VLALVACFEPKQEEMKKDVYKPIEYTDRFCAQFLVESIEKHEECRAEIVGRNEVRVEAHCAGKGTRYWRVEGKVDHPNIPTDQSENCYWQQIEWPPS